jgi:hypothetical protein
VRFRSVRQEYEAVLSPPPSSAGARGKAEWKVYADGTRQGRLTASGLAVPDGAVVEISVNDRLIAMATVDGGRVRFRRESEQGESVPEVALAEVLRLRHAGRVLLEGTFAAE